MAMYKRVQTSVAAATTTNVLSGDQVQSAPYPRTIRAIAVTVRDNTPALGDLTWVLKAGTKEIARGRGILENAAGAEITFPDGFDPVGMIVQPNVFINLEITNTDAAAHSSLVAIDMDQI